jgi:hypothetical protein
VGELRGLTLRQPWAWAIADQGKTIENRTWKTNYRGLVAIHAGARVDDIDTLPVSEAQAALDSFHEAAESAGRLPREAIRIRLGQVVAVAELTGIHPATECAVPGPPPVRLCSPWAVHGEFHWQLANVRPLAEPIPWKGALGLWRVPDDLEQAITEQLETSNA